MIKAVLFDADGVIQSAASSFYADLKGLVESDGDKFVSEVFAAEAPTSTGKADFKEGLQEVLQRWQVEQTIDQVMTIWYQIDMVDGLFDLLADLRGQGIKVALATNQQAYRMEFMGSDLGYDHHFDVSFYSCAVGYRKPEAEFYQHAAAELGLPPEQCLFIDDKPENVEAAIGIGMQGEVFQFSSLAAGKAELEALLSEVVSR